MKTAIECGSNDRAGKDYWDRAWGDEELPPEVDPRAAKIWAHRDQLFHREIERVLAGMRGRQLRVLELGCARSAWLPYFAREFGCQVAGLDYSPLGANQAARRLEESGIAGEIRCADLFSPPPDWVAAFDVVVWFGVAEHFEDTTAAVKAAAEYLQPGGILITEVPNLAGLNGWIQRLFNKPVFDIHVPLAADDLARHHTAAGLQLISSRHLVPTDFGVIDLAGLPPGPMRTIKDRVLYPLRLFSGAVWWLDRRIGPLPAGRFFSGFVITAARKPSPSTTPAEVGTIRAASVPSDG